MSLEAGEACRFAWPIRQAPLVNSVIMYVTQILFISFMHDR